MYIRSHVSEIHYNYNVAQYVANNRFYHIQMFIYILILATYHWVINIFKIIPYVKYRDLLKIIDAEIEEAPMTFEK